MEKKVIFGFTGTRLGLKEEQKNNIINLLNNYTNISVHHGDCIGADTEFHLLCTQYKKDNPSKIINIVIHPPDNYKLRGFNQGDIILEEKQYLKRNDDIIECSEAMIACPFDKNKEEQRSGTWSTIRKTKKLKKPIYIF